MKNILIGFFFLSSLSLQAQVPQWFLRGGSTIDAVGSTVVLDNIGNSYVTGSFEDTLRIGAFTLVSNGGNDIFVAKIGVSGQVIWAKSAGGKFDDFGRSIVVDENLNIYVSSTFQDTAYFDNSVVLSKGGNDLALCKYDNNGNLSWIKSWGSIYDDYWGDKIINKTGNLFLTGTFASYGGSPSVYETINFDQFTLTSNGDADAFVVKMDTSGSIKWAKNGGGKFSDDGGDIDVDEMGNVCITGDFTASSTVYFGNVHLTPKVGPFQDMFVVMYDSSGNALWGSGAGGNYPTGGTAIRFDNVGNVIVTLSSFSSPFVEFDNNITLFGHLFIAKYSSTGLLIWAKNIGTNIQGGIADFTLDSLNNIYLAGSFGNVGILGNDTFSSNGGYDAFISKCDSNLNFIWSTRIGGGGNDANSSIAINNTGIIVTGVTESNQIIFGSSSNIGNNGAFIAKLSCTTGIPIISSSPNDIELYPNPSSGILHLQANKENFTSLKVLDQLGRVVAEHSLQQHQTAIDVQQLTDGIYYLQLKGKGLPVTKKIIIQH